MLSLCHLLSEICQTVSDLRFVCSLAALEALSLLKLKSLRVYFIVLPSCLKGAKI